MKKPFLIKMVGSFNNPEITYHPNPDELRNQLEKFSNNILESTASFGRWWRNFCVVFEEKVNEENAEKYIPYTFLEDVMQNKMVSQLQFEIIKYRNQINDRFDMTTKSYKQKLSLNELFDKNNMIKMQKQLEKTQNTAEIERAITQLRGRKAVFQQQADEYPNYFIIIDMTEIKQAAIERTDEWLEMLAEIMKKIAGSELKNIIRETQDYERALKGEMGDMD